MTRRWRIQPGRGWKWLRRGALSLVWLTILGAPLLGGWQRLDRSEMALWTHEGWNLPPRLLESLPLGHAPAAAYDAMVITGGGSAADVLTIPAIDPVAGLPALLAGGMSLRYILALLIPILFALLVGRVFCGWMCPFGTIARLVASIKPRRVWRIPERRPLRWVILVASMALSALGAQTALLFFLPHVLVQQSIYSLWLLGGGGVVLGALFGLILAGVVFGPTVYCATLCPTGALLGLLGRFRLPRVVLAKAADCGAHCDICDRVCWLGLKPSSGDPGPDCDSCARCFERCPKANLRIDVPGRRHLPVVAALFFGLCIPSYASAEAKKPELLLHSYAQRGDVSVGVGISDLTGVYLDPDAVNDVVRTEVSVTFARGTIDDGDELGKIPLREMYTGPLKVTLKTKSVDYALEFDETNSPRSTQMRSIYRSIVDLRMSPGDTVVIHPVDGWLDQELSFELPPRGIAPSPSLGLLGFAGAALFFMGLLSLALAIPEKRS